MSVKDLKQNKKNEINKSSKIGENKKNSFVTIMLDAVWQKFYLIVILVIIAIGIGYLYNLVRTPDYTTYETVIFTAKNTSAITTIDNGDGTKTEVLNEYSTQHISAANKYVTTLTEFFTTGVVTERAEYYYAQFESLMKAKGYTSELERQSELSTFIETMNKTKFTVRKLIEYKDDADSLFDIVDKSKTTVDASGTTIYTTYYRCKILGYQSETETIEFSYADGEEKSSLLVNEDNIDNYTITLSDFVLNKYVFNDAFLQESGIYYDIKETGVETRKNCLISKDASGEYKYTCGNETYSLVKENIELITFSDYLANYKDVLFDSIDSNVQIEQGNITAANGGTDDKYTFTVTYRDLNAMRSREKVKILILATTQEARRESAKSLKTPESVKKEYVYFDTVEISLNDLGASGTTPNASNKKILLIFAICGFGVAIALIYVLTFFDKTVKSKDEIEELMHAPLLASIEKAKEEDK